MRPTRASALITGLLVLGSTAACTSTPTGGIVEKATNAAQDDRLASYETYAEQGWSAAWVDQHICVVDTAGAVVNVTLAAAYPGQQPDTLAQAKADAAAVGDGELLAALDEAEIQGMRLFNVPELTVREAIRAAIAPCSTDELGGEGVTETVDSVVEMARAEAGPGEPRRPPDGGRSGGQDRRVVRT